MTTIAHQLMTATPPVSAYRAEPFTIAELDSHPDAGRIWATIQAMKDRVDVMAEETDREVDDEIDEAKEAGKDEGYEAALEDVDARIGSLLRKYGGDLSDKLERDILALTDNL